MKVLKNAGFKPEWVELVRPHCADLSQALPPDDAWGL
jgi:hypothetical protein